MASEKEKVLKLLAYILLEIREEAHEVNNKKIFKLADLVHNLPYLMNTKLGNDGAFAEVLEELETRADLKGLSAWLEKAGNSIITEKESD